MAKPLEHLESELLGLSQAQRAHLARMLIVSLEDDEYEDQDAVEAAWAEEIERRVADLRSGRVRAIPADEVLKEIADRTG